MRVSVLFSPAGAEVRSGCAVIVDVLRATSTLTLALAHGARGVIPAATPGEALRLRDSRPGTLACGEREGRIVEGFDLGNSPFEYTEERVRGKTLVFASTNGSQALLAARGATRRVLAAFVNAAAVVRSLRDEREVTIVCAGKLGGFSLEDAVCAGLLVRRLEALGGVSDGPAARLAGALAPDGAEQVRVAVESAAHARDLRALGAAFVRDLEWCAGLDTLDRAFDVGGPGA